MTDEIPPDKTLLLSVQTGGSSAADRLKMATLALLLVVVVCFSALHGGGGVESTNMNQGGVPYGIRHGPHLREIEIGFEFNTGVSSFSDTIGTKRKFHCEQNVTVQR